MSSISVRELINLLEVYNPDAEVVMNIRHKYDIPASPDGWIAFINGCHYDKDKREVRLMN